MLTESWVEGKSVEEKGAQPTERTAALRGLSSKIYWRIWVNFTRNGLRLGWRHQEIPHTDVPGNLATLVVFLLLSHSGTAANVRGDLPGLKGRTGLLPSGPTSLRENLEIWTKNGLRDCRCRLTCDTWMKRHPTCLHNDNYNKDLKKERHMSPDSPSQNGKSETATAMSLIIARDGHSASTSMIVPVWVLSAANPCKEKLVYALLHMQSDTTFIDQEVSRELQVDVCPVKLKLTTMMGENAIVNSEKVCDICVRLQFCNTHAPTLCIRKGLYTSKLWAHSNLWSS